MIRECKECGNEFQGTVRKIFCGRKCAVKNNNAKRDKVGDRNKECKNCGVKFSVDGTTAAYCSDRCRKDFKNFNRRLNYSVELICPQCHYSFISTVRSKKYCSSSCKKKANYYRNIEAEKIRKKEYRLKNEKSIQERMIEWRKVNKHIIREYNKQYLKRDYVIERRKETNRTLTKTRADVYYWIKRSIGITPPPELVEEATAVRLLRRSIKKAGE